MLISRNAEVVHGHRKVGNPCFNGTQKFYTGVVALFPVFTRENTFKTNLNMLPLLEHKPNLRLSLIQTPQTLYVLKLNNVSLQVF